VLPKSDPEDTIIKGLLDAFVMAEGPSHRGFAIATRTTQSGSDRNRLLPLLVKHFVDQRVEFMRTRHEVRRQVFHHERHPHLLTARVEVIDKLCPFMGKVIEVCVAHPTRQAGKVQGGYPHDGIDTDALLAGIAPFLAYCRRLHGGRSHDYHHELDLVKRLGDLLPPVSSPFHTNAILPEGNMFCQEPLTRVCGERLSITTGIGNEDTRRLSAFNGACCHDVPLHKVSVVFRSA